MADSASTAGVVGFTAFGVAGSVRAEPPELLARARALLPPGWSPGPSTPTEGRFTIDERRGSYEVTLDGESRIVTPEREVALAVLDSQLRAHVAFHAPERVFVHAGVVARDGRAILIPGPSFSGKTTLVAALIAAGAVYYSDEYAVLDADGLVHPYPKPLSIREESARGDHTPQSLGAVVGHDPLPVAVVAITSYRPGARWRPERRSPGDGAMALLANTVPARDRPREALAAVSRAAADALILEGERGDAPETATDLLAR
jgi:hypothetical protein